MMALFSIAKNTFIQTIRQPFFNLVCFIAIVLLVLSVPLCNYSMGTDFEKTDQEMLKNIGLSTSLVFGMLLATFCASSAISREILDKTALTVIAKPIGRPVFVLGKFLGVAGAVTLGYYIISIVFLLTVRHGVLSSARMPVDWPIIVIGCSALLLALILAGIGNYLFQWNFMSSLVLMETILLSITLLVISMVGKHWKIISMTETFSEDGIGGPLLVGIVLMYLAVLLITSIAVAASTRMGQLMTLVLTLAVLFAGSMYHWLFHQLGLALPGGQYAVWALPCLPFFYPMDALARNQALPFGMISAYFACYIAGMLALAVALFQNRELAAAEGSSSMPTPLALLSGLGRIAAVVMAIVGVILLVRPQTYQAGMTSILTAVGLLPAAVGGYFLFHAVGQHRRWGYWVLLSLAGLVAFHGSLLMTEWTWVDAVRFGANNARSLLSVILAGVVIVILLLPKTRAHFRSEPVQLS